MSVMIHTIDLGVARGYLVRSAGVIAIDGGAPGKGPAFASTLVELGVPPHDVQLIVLTHSHLDHVGSAGEMKALTGAKLAMHRREKALLEGARAGPAPSGVTVMGKVISGALRLLAPFMRDAGPQAQLAAQIDVILEDEVYPLAGYGIPGRVLCTPGHSPGSVSVLLDRGDAFVGDLAMNMYPLQRRPGLPILAEDVGQVRDSWRLLLEEGARTIYPAHGEPFPASVLHEALEAA